ncbi:MAG: nitronate monooxygenase [Bacteroidales bacterium]|jgi:enoyl-[acyl-carrier protein] reductase II|nr:nitronate monooxygenase [Bacteroidales bacterium]
MNNIICDILNIKTPIISGGMVWCSNWFLASSVSNQGGLGLIGAGSMTPEILEEHIKKCKDATNKPFGINIPLMNVNSEKNIAVAIKHKVDVVFTSAGNPTLYTQRLKDNGIKVIHVIANNHFALKAQNAGCDAVVAEGFEAGGHNGKEEITTLVLLEQLRGKLNIPVIAAGGIVSGKQILAAMLLGAQGVQIGTLFATSKESSGHINFKNAVINSTEGDTMLLLRKLSPTRLLKGNFFNMIKEAEDKGATEEELLNIIQSGRPKLGMFEGDLTNGELEIGQAASIINESLSVEEIFSKLKREYKEAFEELKNLNKDLVF